MSQTLQNQLLLSKSMNGIISFDDGAGTTIQNGQIVTNDLSGNAITTNSFNTNDLMLQRKSVPAVNNVLGSTIDVDLLIQNFTFDTTYRVFKAISDNSITTILAIDVATNLIEIAGDDIYTYLTNQYLIGAPDIQFQNSGVSFPNSTVTIDRKSKPALNTYLGSTINVNTLLQNLNFNTTTRNFEIWDDQATGQIFSIDVSNNGIQMSPKTMSIYPLTALNFNCSNTTFTNSNVSFPSSTVSFNSNLPTTTITTGFTNNAFITKAYGDGAYQIAGTGPTLSGANAWTGNTNTFNSNLPTSTLTPTTDYQLINKIYADNKFTTLSGANAWTGTNTFNSNLPTSTIVPTTDYQLINKIYADNKFATLSGVNAWTGNTNTFNSYLPTSTLTPTTNEQLTNKLYVDNKVGTVPVYVKNDANTNSFLLGSGNSTLTGYQNFAGGSQALNFVTTGYLNVGIGQKALYTCQGGTENFGLGSNSLYSLTSGSFNTAIGVFTGSNLTTGISNTFIGRYCGGALTTQNNNTFVGYFCGVNSTGEGNTIYGAYSLGAGCSGSSNTIVGFSSGTIGSLTGSNNTIIGSGANLGSTTISNSCAIGTGAIATASNQIMLGRATETVQVPGTLQISSVSAIASTITVNNNIIHKKYYLSMVNPTVLTGTSPLTMSAPIYEYVQLNLASGIVNLPLSSEVEIGTVIRFRRITTMTGAISLQVQTGSGQAILGRNSVSAVSISTFLAANVTYGSVVFLSSNLWAINE